MFTKLRLFRMLPIVIGIDEVGRGAVAGPMYLAAAVITYREPWFVPFSRVNDYFEFYLDVKNRVILRDSKKLSFKQRLEASKILGQVLDYYLVSIDNHFIDNYGLSLAFKKGLEKILNKINQHYPLNQSQVLVDGKFLPNLDIDDLPRDIETIVKGDYRVGIIAAASVLAKVSRDRLMIKLGHNYPRYFWSSNMGYASHQHLSAIRKYGLTPYHRRSFLKRFFSLNKSS